jgi:hypothetical protein
MIPIPLAETKPHKLSYADPNGRLFWWQGELYRGIRLEKASFYTQLFDRGIVQRLVEEKLLIDTKLTTLSVDGFGLVIKPRLLPFVSYVYEWCAPMLKEAALVVVNLEMMLMEHGLGLQDCHPWNVLFDATRPLFVDFSSIVTAYGNDLWEANGEFFRYYIYPLQAMAKGQTRIVRSLLLGDNHGISQVEGDFLTRQRGATVKESVKRMLRTSKNHLPDQVHSTLHNCLRSIDITVSGRAPRSHETRLAYLHRLRNMVEDIEVPRVQTDWSNYYDDGFPQLFPTSDWSPKQNNVYRIITEQKPKTLIDIGANRGWYSLLAAQLGINTLGTDVDEECINQLFYEAKERNLSVLPLVLDFRNPSPGIGVSNDIMLAATERLKCEMVMALALVHHLVFKFHLNFDQIVRGLSDFTTKDLLVEFVPKEDRYVKEWWTPAWTWYTLEEFEKVLRRYFNQITIWSSDPAPRVLLFCQK